MTKAYSNTSNTLLTQLVKNYNEKRDWAGLGWTGQALLGCTGLAGPFWAALSWAGLPGLAGWASAGLASS